MLAVFAGSGGADVPPMFTAKHFGRDPMHVADIAGASPASSRPFARTATASMRTDDVDGAQPRRPPPPREPLPPPDDGSRSPFGRPGLGARKHAIPPSGRNPIDPVYKLPTVDASRWAAVAAEPPFAGVYRARVPRSGHPRGRGDVRDTLYTVDAPAPLYFGAKREPPPPVDGSRPRPRAREPSGARPSLGLDVSDISEGGPRGAWRRRQRARDEAEAAGAPGAQPRRDPLDPEYAYDLGPGGVGPVSAARHIAPVHSRRGQLMRRARPTGGVGMSVEGVDGATADSITAPRRAMATRAGALRVDDIEGAQVGTRGDGFVLYRRPDYTDITGRARPEYNAPGLPHPPSKTTNKLDDIEGTNPGSGFATIRIYRPSHVDHASRTAALIRSNGVPADADEPTPPLSAHVAHRLARAQAEQPRRRRSAAAEPAPPPREAAAADDERPPVPAAAEPAARPEVGAHAEAADGGGAEPERAAAAAAVAEAAEAAEPAAAGGPAPAAPAPRPQGVGVHALESHIDALAGGLTADDAHMQADEFGFESAYGEAHAGEDARESEDNPFNRKHLQHARAPVYDVTAADARTRAVERAKEVEAVRALP